LAAQKKEIAMKTNSLKPALLGLVGLFALTSVSLLAQSTTPVDPSAPPQVKPDNRLTKNISGKLSAKTENSLTVDGRTVTTSGATTYSKNGTSIGSGDVNVGDTLNIVTTDDGQVAVSVNVTVSS
jgi:hypothetical protein